MGLLGHLGLGKGLQLLFSLLPVLVIALVVGWLISKMAGFLGKLKPNWGKLGRIGVAFLAVVGGLTLLGGVLVIPQLGINIGGGQPIDFSPLVRALERPFETFQQRGEDPWWYTFINQNRLQTVSVPQLEEIPIRVADIEETEWVGREVVTQTVTVVTEWTGLPENGSVTGSASPGTVITGTWRLAESPGPITSTEVITIVVTPGTPVRVVNTYGWFIVGTRVVSRQIQGPAQRYIDELATLLADNGEGYMTRDIAPGFPNDAANQIRFADAVYRLRRAVARSGIATGTDLDRAIEIADWVMADFGQRTLTEEVPEVGTVSEQGEYDIELEALWTYFLGLEGQGNGIVAQIPALRGNPQKAAQFRDDLIEIRLRAANLAAEARILMRQGQRLQQAGVTLDLRDIALLIAEAEALSGGGS